MKIPIIISSYNRPAQLDLCLRSIEKYFKNRGQIYIITKSSNDSFYEGYIKVFNTNYKSDIMYYKENEEYCYNKIFKEILKESQSKYILFLSDDCIFINNTILPADFKLFDNEYGFSLRLSENITYCQPANLNIEPPKVFPNYEYISWNYKNYDKRGCWGYAMPYDSTIYRINDIYKMIQDVYFRNPYELENYLHNEYNNDMKTFCRCFKEQKCISVSNNQTGQGANNPHGNQTIDFLNEKFLRGYRLKLETFENKIYNAAHIIQPYEFEKND